MLYRTIIALACGLSLSTGAPASMQAPIEVSASFNAVAELTKIVGQDKVRIATIVPNGTEPHDFDPNPSALKQLTKADLFIINGFNMEHWLNPVKENFPKLRIVKAADGFNSIEIKTADHEQGDHQHDHTDPHIWLSPNGAAFEAKQIAAALCKVSSSDCAFFKHNADAFASDMQQLIREYQPKFAALKHKVIVTGHAAFAYLGRDFNLQQLSVENVFAEGEPSPRQLAALADLCKQKQIKVVFAEEMASPKVSAVLAQEAGAQIETLYTMESEEDNLDFKTRMRTNIERIYNALK